MREPAPPRLGCHADTTIVVGNDLDGGAVIHPFTGMLDDLRLYGRALGADEIARLSGDRPRQRPRASEGGTARASPGSIAGSGSSGP